MFFFGLFAFVTEFHYVVLTVLHAAHYIDQFLLQTNKDLPNFASHMLGPKVYTILPGSVNIFSVFPELCDPCYYINLCFLTT